VILQRLDPTLTSHMFRRGASKKYLILGYTPYDPKERTGRAARCPSSTQGRRVSSSPEEVRERREDALERFSPNRPAR
jgi:hypothetical protein